jgi:hypothetical protein
MDKAPPDQLAFPERSAVVVGPWRSALSPAPSAPTDTRLDSSMPDSLEGRPAPCPPSACPRTLNSRTSGWPETTKCWSCTRFGRVGGRGIVRCAVPRGGPTHIAYRYGPSGSNRLHARPRRTASAHGLSPTAHSTLVATIPKRSGGRTRAWRAVSTDLRGGSTGPRGANRGMTTDRAAERGRRSTPRGPAGTVA